MDLSEKMRSQEREMKESLNDLQAMPLRKSQEPKKRTMMVEEQEFSSPSPVKKVINDKNDEFSASPVMMQSSKLQSKPEVEEEVNFENKRVKK
jgi:hypothetical protein